MRCSHLILVLCIQVNDFFFNSQKKGDENDSDDLELA